MEREDKELLYKDLCSRMPYHIKVQWGERIFNIIDIGFGRVTLIIPFMSCTSGTPLIEEVKPLLRPLDDMTDEEKAEYNEISSEYLDDYLDSDNDYSSRMLATCKLHQKSVEYLDSHFFDHRGLIERELAIKTTKETYENLIGQIII